MIMKSSTSIIEVEDHAYNGQMQNFHTIIVPHEGCTSETSIVAYRYWANMDWPLMVGQTLKNRDPGTIQALGSSIVSGIYI